MVLLLSSSPSSNRPVLRTRDDEQSEGILVIIALTKLRGGCPLSELKYRVCKRANAELMYGSAVFVGRAFVIGVHPCLAREEESTVVGIIPII